MGQRDAIRNNYENHNDWNENLQLPILSPQFKRYPEVKDVENKSIIDRRDVLQNNIDWQQSILNSILNDNLIKSGELLLIDYEWIKESLQQAKRTKLSDEFIDSYTNLIKSIILLKKLYVEQSRQNVWSIKNDPILDKFFTDVNWLILDWWTTIYKKDIIKFKEVLKNKLNLQLDWKTSREKLDLYVRTNDETVKMLIVNNIFEKEIIAKWYILVNKGETYELNDINWNKINWIIDWIEVKDLKQIELSSVLKNNNLDKKEITKNKLYITLIKKYWLKDSSWEFYIVSDLDKLTWRNTELLKKINTKITKSKWNIKSLGDLNLLRSIVDNSWNYEDKDIKNAWNISQKITAFKTKGINWISVEDIVNSSEPKSMIEKVLNSNTGRSAIFMWVLAFIFWAFWKDIPWFGRLGIIFGWIFAMNAFAADWFWDGSIQWLYSWFKKLSWTAVEITWTSKNEPVPKIYLLAWNQVKSRNIIEAKNWFSEDDNRSIFMQLSNNATNFKNKPISSLKSFVNWSITSTELFWNEIPKNEKAEIYSDEYLKKFSTNLWLIQETWDNNIWDLFIYKGGKKINEEQSDTILSWIIPQNGNVLTPVQTTIPQSGTVLTPAQATIPQSGNVVKPIKPSMPWQKKPKKKINSENIIFDIDWIELKNIQNNLSILWLDFFKFLDVYSLYINNNLKNLGIWVKEKIKNSIEKRILAIGDILDELKIKAEDDRENFINYRWIANSKIKDLFDDINNKVLPSLALLSKIKWWENINLNIEQKNQLIELDKMLSEDLTNEWKFDKLTITEWYDNVTDNWNIFDFTDEDDKKFLERNKIKGSEDISLLVEDDIDIEDTAIMTYFAMLALQIWAEFTPIWWIGWAAIDWADIFTDEEVLLTIAKTMPWVSSDYLMEKHWYDNVLAWIWLIPWATILTKSTKLWDFISKMKPKQLNKFYEIYDKFLRKMADKFWWGDDIISSLKWNFDKIAWLKNKIPKNNPVTARFSVNSRGVTDDFLNKTGSVTSTVKKGYNSLKNSAWKVSEKIKNIKSFDIKLKTQFKEILENAPAWKIDDLPWLNILKKDNWMYKVVDENWVEKLYKKWDVKKILEENFSKIDLKARFWKISEDLLKKIDGTDIVIDWKIFTRIVEEWKIKLFDKISWKEIIWEELLKVQEKLLKRTLLDVEKTWFWKNIKSEKVWDILSESQKTSLFSKVKNKVQANKLTNWLYNKSIWDLITELKVWSNKKWLAKLSVLKTLLFWTWNGSTNFLLKSTAVGWYTFAEMSLLHEPWEEEFLTNYFEIMLLHPVWVAIYELFDNVWPLYDKGKEILK